MRALSHLVVPALLIPLAGPAFAQGAPSGPAEGSQPRTIILNEATPADAAALIERARTEQLKPMPKATNLPKDLKMVPMPGPAPTRE
jgi:hypothetical protein